MLGSQLFRPFASSSCPPSFTSTGIEAGRLYRPSLPHRTIIICSGSAVDNVFSTEDIIGGVVLAVVLASTVSFLQGQRAQNDFVLWEKDGTEDLSDMKSSEKNVVFRAEEWKEVSSPDNYILYKQRLREREMKKKSSQTFPLEKTWVFIALLALFVPIFSVEFFFTLSRQVLCGGNLMDQSELAEFLCSPATSL